MKKVILLSSVFSLVLSGCVNNPKQAVGTLGGGAVGALLGSQFGKGRGRLLGTALGAILGAGIGGSIGNYMDDQDKQAASQAQINALENAEDGKSVSWKNPNNGHHGDFQPTRTFEQNGQPCREFYHNVNIGGRVEQVRGVACRDVSGDWKITQ